MYEEIKLPLTDITIIKKYSENGVEFCIPIDENNSDYQDYLVWKTSQEDSV